jgi:hypothetical protein
LQISGLHLARPTLAIYHNALQGLIVAPSCQGNGYNGNNRYNG